MTDRPADPDDGNDSREDEEDRTLVADGVTTDAESNGVASGERDLSNPALYLNRELSELEFQRRVLAEATDGRNAR